MLSSNVAIAATKSVAGTLCKKAGTTQTVSGKAYVCASVNKKLSWKLKPAPIATTPAGPTWAQIAAEKAAAAAKVAEEIRIKVEAQAKAAAELKAKQDAEAMAAAQLKAQQEAAAKAAAAAKAEAEKPKVAGLVIGEL